MTARDAFMTKRGRAYTLKRSCVNIKCSWPPTNTVYIKQLPHNYYCIL